MKHFLSKTQSEVTLGDSFIFIAIYMAAYLAIMGVVMKWDEVVSGIKKFCRKVKEWFVKLKTKLIG